MAKHAGQEKIRKVLDEFKAGTLKTSAGKKVTDPEQARAIAMSEANAAEKKNPNRKKAPTAPGQKLKKKPLAAKKVLGKPKIGNVRLTLEMKPKYDRYIEKLSIDRTGDKRLSMEDWLKPDFGVAEDGNIYKIPKRRK